MTKAGTPEVVPNHRRSSVAVAICVLSGMIGAISLSLGAQPFWVALVLFLTWSSTADWLRGMRFYSMSPSQLFARARSGRLSPVRGARSISAGAWVMLCIAIYTKFFL